MTAGNSLEMVTPFSGTEDTAGFRAGWPVGDAMDFTVTSPDGTEYGSNSAEYIAAVGYVMINISQPATGNWKSEIIAVTVNNADGSNVTLEISGQTSLSVSVECIAKAYPQPIAILAAVNGPEPVVGATVVASITPPEGVDPISDIGLKDDGLPPDREADDGVYSGVLSKYTLDGQYLITVSQPRWHGSLEYTGGSEKPRGRPGCGPGFLGRTETNRIGHCRHVRIRNIHFA